MRAGRLFLLFAALVCYLPAFGQAQSQARPQPGGNPVQQTLLAAQRAEEAARVAVAAKADAEKQRDETLKRLDTVSNDLIGRATFLDTASSRLIAFVQFAVWTGTFLALIAAGVTGYSVVDSRRKITQNEKIASAAVEKIVEMKEGVEKHKLFLSTLQAQVRVALEEIQKAMQAPAATPGTALIGVDLASAVPQRSYDDDALVAFADRLGITDFEDSKLAEFLVTFGNYWRRMKGRAIERIRRALELDPQSAMAHKSLGRAFWNKVGEELDASGAALSPEQANLLTTAEAHLVIAKDLLVSRSENHEDILYDLGMISRYRSDISKAIDFYEEGAKVSKRLAQTEKREPDWDFDYAIGCLYAKDPARYQQALDKLREVADKKKTWVLDRLKEEDRDYRKWMKSDDPDLDSMRKDGTWGPRLLAL